MANVNNRIASPTLIRPVGIDIKNSPATTASVPKISKNKIMVLLDYKETRDWFFGWFSCCSIYCECACYRGIYFSL